MMALLAVASALAMAMGLFSIAHIENAWLRGLVMGIYVVMIVGITIGLPILLDTYA